jgi:PAS domain S-box-containing protein
VSLHDDQRIRDRLATIADPTAFLINLFAHAPVGFAVWTADGAALLTNRAFIDLFLVEPPPEYNVLKDELLAANGMLPLFQRAFAGETVNVPTFWYDPRELTSIKVEHGRRVAISMTIFPLFRADGSIEYVAATYKDQTELMLITERLARSEESQRLAHLAARAGTFEWNIQTGENRWTPEFEAMYGLAPGEFGNSQASWEALVHPDDRASAIARVEEALASGSPVEGEWRVVWRDGAVRWLFGRFQVVPDEHGRPARLIGVNVDVTERKQQEAARRAAEAATAALHEANRMKSAFLANMSHELRTPLNSIIGFGELLHDEEAGPMVPIQKEFAGNIVTSGRHLLQLINDILDLSKVEAGKMELRAETVVPAAIVADVAAQFALEAAARSIRLTTDVAPDLEAIVIDPTRLKQVMFNYVSNAIKFTEPGGDVRISILPTSPDEIEVRVEDTGIGIAADDIPSLFVEFQQLDASAGKHHPGTGLGLALTRRLVEAMGGEVGVTSVLGRGSVFRATLPRQPRIWSPDQPPIAGVSDAPRTATLEILIVDDDPGSRKLMEATLEQLGFQSVAVADATAALRYLDTCVPMAVVVDLMMPEIDGFELIERMRGLSGCEHVPIIVWTVKDLTIGEGYRLRDRVRVVISKASGSARDGLGDILRANLPSPA